MRIRIGPAALAIAGALICVDPAACEDTQDTTSGEQTFAGIRFGVGISFTHDLGVHQRISRAKVVDGVVRIEKTQNDLARIMLESHYFFLPTISFFGVAPGRWGFGPFVAIQPGDEEVINAVGVGLLVGFKRHIDDRGSWNFGVGLVVDPCETTLGEGIEVDKPLPAGETQIRYQETSQGGLLGIVSFSF